MAHAAAQALRAVLRDVEVGEPLTDVLPRSLAELRAKVAAVNAASAACDYGILGQTVPDLIGELSTLAEVNGSTEARRLLVDVLHAAFYLSNGQSSVRFSKGLRHHLGMDAALTDEELAEEVGSETELYLTQKLYRRVFNDCQALKLLRHWNVAACRGGVYWGMARAADGGRRPGSKGACGPPQAMCTSIR